MRDVHSQRMGGIALLVWRCITTHTKLKLISGVFRPLQGALTRA